MAFEDDSLERDLGLLSPAGYGAKMVYDKVQRQALIDNLLRRVEASRLPIGAKEEIGKLALKNPRQMALWELMGADFKGGRTRSGYFEPQGAGAILRHLNNPDAGPLPSVQERKIRHGRGPAPLRPPIFQVGGTTAPFHPETWSGRLRGGHGIDSWDDPIGGADIRLTGSPDIRRPVWDYIQQNPSSTTTHEFGHGAQFLGQSTPKEINDLAESSYDFNRAMLNRHPANRLTAPELTKGLLNARLSKPGQLARLAQAAEYLTGELGAERTSLTRGLLDAGVQRTEIPAVIQHLQTLNPHWKVSPERQRIATMKQGGMIDLPTARKMEEALGNQRLEAIEHDDVDWNVRGNEMPERQALQVWKDDVAEAQAIKQKRNVGYRANQGLARLMETLNDSGVKNILRKLF